MERIGSGWNGLGNGFNGLGNGFNGLGNGLNGLGDGLAVLERTAYPSLRLPDKLCAHLYLHFKIVIGQNNQECQRKRAFLITGRLFLLPALRYLSGHTCFVSLLGCNVGATAGGMGLGTLATFIPARLAHQCHDHWFVNAMIIGWPMIMGSSMGSSLVGQCGRGERYPKGHYNNRGSNCAKSPPARRRPYTFSAKP